MFSLKYFSIITLIFLYPLVSGNLNRAKRHIFFLNGGTFKIVIGFAIPIKLGQKQSMACGWNFQFQYKEPKTINDTKIYPPIISKNSRKKRTLSDRMVFYMAIEEILNRSGLNGRACLLRSICENASISVQHEANGLYGRLLHIVLTPDHNMTVGKDSVYLEAKIAGDFGVDCTSLYPQCGLENALLDSISVF